MISRRRRGPVPLEDLVAARVTRGQIEYRLKTRRLRILHPAVYAIGYRELDEVGSWSAAVCAANPDAALGCRSGGRYLGIVDHYKGRIEVLVPRPDPPSLRGVHVRAATTLTKQDVITRDGIRVTSLARTLLDLAGVFNPEALSHSFQKAMRLGLKLNDVDDVIDRNPRSKGRKTLRTLVALHRDDKGFGKGGFENAFYPLLKAVVRKRFTIERNVKVLFDDGIEREADFLVNGRFWIETDHYGHHAGAGPKKAMEDLQRERIIRAAGYEFARYLDYEFATDKAAIRADLRRKLGLDG